MSETETAPASGPVTLADVRQYFSETIMLGTTGAGAHKAMYARVVSGRENLVTELSKLRKAQLSRMTGAARDMKHEQLVRAAFDDLLQRFTLARTFSFTFGAKFETVVAGYVEKITDERMNEYRAEAVEASAERAVAATAKQKAITDPETEQEFETFIWHHGMKALAALAEATKLPRKRDEQEAILRREGIKAMSDDQLARWDELQAAKARERRARETVERATVRRIEIGEGNYMEVIKWWHDKRMCDTWLVVLAEREDRTTFEELCVAARKLGGNYSRQWGDRPGGFQFFDEAQAEKFVMLQSKDVFELSRLEKILARREAVRSNAVAHFTGMAGRMEERAADSLSRPRLENTERRLMLAENARDRAHADVAMAKTLREHAQALLARTAVHLDRIRWRTHAEALDRLLRRADGRMSLVEYPWPRVGKHSLREVARQIGHLDGSKLVAARVLKMCDERAGDVVVFAGDHAADTLRHFYRRARLHRVKGWALDSVREALGDFKRMRLNNLDSLPELRAALREHQGRRVEPSGMTRAEKVMRDLYSGQYPPDYFPTPLDVVALMLEYADAWDGMTWLEPSAGGGHIVNVVQDLHPNARGTYVEISGLLCRALEAQAHYPVQSDFLRLSGNWCVASEEGGFDRVIANVPFGCDGVGTDIDHVRHAFGMLKPGGRLVSLMSDGVFYRGDNKAQEFRAWLEEIGGESFELPEGAFLDSDRPTSWAARIVVIDRE